MTNKQFFTLALLRWNKHKNARQMPWKGEKNAYKIWISEIILQQTRVQQGLQYYNKFIKAFPTVQHIANAKEDDVFKLWEGLGYYSRCRNIIHSAKYISKELNGVFPQTFADIINLKGIGNYTASAIASFAYNLPHAVVDGNVFRLLSRFFGIQTPIDTTEGKKLYTHLADELLDKKLPGIYNQTIMDFGAVICKPLPLCNICPLNSRCIAFKNGLINVLPIKEKRIIKRVRWLYYLVIEYNKNVYVKKRIAKDIWQNLYEFVLIETSKPLSIAQLQATDEFKNILEKVQYKITEISEIYKQQLTHQTLSGQFIRIKLKQPLSLHGYEKVSQKDLEKLPFPKFITAYLKQ